MKRVLLMRHAKSDWSGDAQEDHDRPLNKRGRKAAALMARFIADEHLAPDHIVCSTARRAVATVKPLLDALPRLPETRFTRELYLASPEAMLEAIQDAPDEAGSVMLVGHNPGFQMLALLLAADDGTALHRAMGEKFPTGALAVLTFDCDRWADVEPGRGRLERFDRPKALAEPAAGSAA